MDIDTRSPPDVSPVNGKPIVLGFNGADMSSDAGLTLLPEIERQTVWHSVLLQAWWIRVIRPRFSTVGTISSTSGS